jgi:DNA-binding HxlR family transcriptional regulator
MSSSVLNDRLRELREADVVRLAPAGYELSKEGQALLDAYEPLQAWAKRWARRTSHA